MNQWSFMLVYDDARARAAKEVGGSFYGYGTFDLLKSVAGIGVGLVGMWGAALTVNEDYDYEKLLLNPKIIELCRLNSPPSEAKELDEAPDKDKLKLVNAWLLRNGFDAIEPATNKDFVNQVFKLFAGKLDGEFDCTRTLVAYPAEENKQNRIELDGTAIG